MAEAWVGPGGADAALPGPPPAEADLLDARSEPPPASQLPMAMVELTREPEQAAESLGPARPSFEELYASSYQSLVRLAYVLTGSIEVSEDLVQDCFVRLHRRYGELESPHHYAKQAVVNACRSHFRRMGRERDRRPLLYVVDSDGGRGGSGATGELHDVLLTLPYRQRAAVVLRYYADLSEQEIADVLGCRPGTVGSLVHRGLASLRKVLEP